MPPGWVVSICVDGLSTTAEETCIMPPGWACAIAMGDGCATTEEETCNMPPRCSGFVSGISLSIREERASLREAEAISTGRGSARGPSLKGEDMKAGIVVIGRGTAGASGVAIIAGAVTSNGLEDSVVRTGTTGNGCSLTTVEDTVINPPG